MAVVGDAYIVVKAITTGFENDIRRAASGINLGSDGRAVGESFTKGFNNGVSKGLGKKFNFSAGEADAARKAFQSLVRTNYVLTASIGPLISSIGALGGGLVSLASSLLAAAPAGVVFATALTSIGIAALGLMGALKGVGAAISAGSKAQKGSTKDKAAEEEAIKRVLRATERFTEAQYAFAKATAAAKEEVQQLGFDSEDAAIGEKKAAIELEKARETLARVQDLPPNSRARREAQLAFAEADLNLRKAKDRNSDLRKEQERLGDSAEKAGTKMFEQTDTYLDANKNQIDALVDLIDAQKAQEKAKNSGTGDTAFADAMAGLSKEAQGFVKYMVDTFMPSLKELRDALGSKLFGQLETGLEKLRTKLFPELKPVLKDLGDSIGKSFGTIIKAITDIENIGDLKKVIENAGINIQSYAKIVGSLYDSFLSVLVSAQPLATKFNKFLEKKTAGWAKYLDAKQATGELQKMFDKAGDIAARIGTVFGNAISGIVNITKANFTPGGGGYILLDYFKDVTEEFEKFSGSVAGQNALSDYFKGAAENSKAILGSVGAFVKEILKVGADPNVKLFWDTLKEGAPVFGDILKSATESGPSLARLVVSLLKFAKATTDAGAIKIFFDTLNVVLTAINTLLENKLVKAIFNATGKVLAFVLALGTIGKIGGFGAKVLSGNFQQLGKVLSAVLPEPVITGIKSGFETVALKGMYAFDAVKNGAKATAKAIATEMGGALKEGGTKLLDFGKVAGLAAKEGLATLLTKLGLLRVFLLTNPLGIAITVVTLLAGLFITLYKNSETFRTAVDKAFTVVREAAENAFNWLKTNWPLVLAILTGPIGLAVLAIATNWDSIVATAKSFVTRMKSALSGVWDGLKDGLSNAWNGVKLWWNRNIAKSITISAPSWLGGKSATIGIPQLAKGGIISPSYGGTLARIGEAGRAERIEPLDPDGLSKRDKAMIKMLSGGGDGMTINVYPSPGMNESELANMVSRQIAFQMRKGGA